ncbi:MAG: hypothetical protein NZM09_12065 [Ignavibacterium sp.]|nr:hypothetical protein [Ignavibacterium sp.]MDW8376410.1 hypothetical protein [Ignavibacteriales bacterium]
MIKYNKIIPAIINYLKQHHSLTGVNIEQGKFNEIPTVAPAVWVYIEPARNGLSDINLAPIIKKAKVTFFAFADASGDKTSASIASVDLIEEIESIILSPSFTDYINQHEDNIDSYFTKVSYTDSEQPLNFDAVYSDFAVSYLEIWINYASS